MKSQIKIIAGTLVASVVLSVATTQIIGVSSTGLARTIKKDPYTFMEAVRSSSEKYQKIAQTKATEGEEERIKKELKKPNQILTKDRVTFGPKQAPITIVEFSDFQCPYCAQASPRMKSLIKKYKGKVNVVYKNFPLNFHPFAKPAAEHFEALALLDKNKAKKFHDLIFDNFSSYARVQNDSAVIKKHLRSLVTKAGGNWTQVQAQLSKAKKIVEGDLEEAKKLNVRGTPSFFVNGVNPGRKKIEDIIDMMLEKK